MVRTSCPKRDNDRGKEKTTSPKPPTLAKGASSEDTNNIFIRFLLNRNKEAMLVIGKLKKYAVSRKVPHPEQNPL